MHRLLTELVRWAVCALVLSGPRGTATRITRELGKAQGWAQKIVSELRDVAGEDAVNVTPPSDQERVT